MKNVYLLVFALLLASCASAPYSSLGKSNVITAYTESGSLKYYVRPFKMLSENYKADKAYLMIDFTYQMQKRDYVVNAYVNFTVYDKTTAFIEGARFLLPENKVIELSDISTLDRDTYQGYIRVTTILEKQSIKDVLEKLQSLGAKLEVAFDDGTSKQFVATKETVERINEVFSK